MTKFDAYKAELADALALRFEAQARAATLAPCKGIVSTHNVNDVTRDNAKQILALYNASMFATLSNIEKSATHDVIAKIMFESKVDAARIMRAERSGALYNVYAYEKDIRIARCLASVASVDAYTRAVLKTCEAFTKADLVATHADFEAAITRSKTGNAQRDALICYFEAQKGASTARTQVSSSVNALQSFNVLSETRDASNRVAYKLNSEHKNTKKLLELVK